MEATAKHNFKATSGDELSFNRGDVLNIINMTEDQNWFKAENKQGQGGYIPANYIDLKPNPWFLGPLSRDDARNILMERREDGYYRHPDGGFLVRPSESVPGQFSLSVKIGDDVDHYRVVRDDSIQYYLWDTAKFDSLNALIAYYQGVPVNRSQTITLQQMTREKVRANYDFRTTDPAELAIRRGDIITVLNRQTTDGNNQWWLGELVTTGKRGLFPANYVSPM